MYNCDKYHLDVASISSVDAPMHSVRTLCGIFVHVKESVMIKDFYHDYFKDVNWCKECVKLYPLHIINETEL